MSGDYFDFVIECGSRQFKVHRSIICPQSSFLEKLCVSKFKEGVGAQASLQETDPDVFEKALDFLYAGTYDDGTHGTPATLTPTTSTTATQQARYVAPSMMQQDMEGTSDISSSEIIETQSIEDRLNNIRNCEGSALLLNVQLYYLAEFLQVTTLKQEALKRCTKLLEECFDAASFVDGIKEAFTHVNELDLDLRARMIRSCVENKQTVANYAALDELLMEFEPIAWTVLKEKETKYEKDQEEQTRNIYGLTEQIDLLEANIKLQMYEISTTKKEIELAYNLVRDYEKCRNCGQEFGAYLEKGYDDKIDVLRCTKCRCRHGPAY